MYCGLAVSRRRLSSINRVDKLRREVDLKLQPHAFFLLLQGSNPGKAVRHIDGVSSGIYLKSLEVLLQGGLVGFKVLIKSGEKLT